jgi:hypothetical protein
MPPVRPRPVPSVEESLLLLHRDGWTAGGRITMGPEGRRYHVGMANRGRRIQVDGLTRAEAWWLACQHARLLDVLGVPLVGQG